MVRVYIYIVDTGGAKNTGKLTFCRAVVGRGARVVVHARGDRGRAVLRHGVPLGGAGHRVLDEDGLAHGTALGTGRRVTTSGTLWKTERTRGNLTSA